MWIRIEDNELATILAALRYWQREGLASDGAEHDIATDGGKIEPLQPPQIDQLCERINSQPTDEERAFVAAADGWNSADDVQVDSDAAVSVADEGAWVMAWVWISNEDAGIEETEGDEVTA